MERTRDRLEKLIQITSHAFAVSLAFGERDAVGGDRVVLGIEADEASSTEYRLLKGRALHLLGHYLSDVHTAAAEATVYQKEDRPRFVDLWHALEDARLENGMLRRWPGMGKAFGAKLPPNLGGALLKLMPASRQIELGLYLDGRGLAGAKLSPQVRAALDEVGADIQRGATGNTPHDSVEAVVAIYPRLGSLLLGEVGQGADDERGSALLDGKSSSQRHEAEEARDIDRRALPDIVFEEGLVSVGVRGRLRELPEWYRPGSAPWFERGLGEKKIHPSALRSDRETIVSAPGGDLAAYRDLWIEVQREGGFLLARLMRVLKEEAYLRYLGRYRTGKLEMNKLWKQRLGDYRLFQRMEGGGEQEVAFSLLVDESASMQGQDKYRMAAKAAILLGETLGRLNVPLEITGFTTASFEAREAMRLGLTPAHAYRTMRCSPLEHRIYKSFDEPYRYVRTRLAGIQPRHNNWDEEHLLFAWRRIQSRREPTKVVMVISDGQPNGDANHLIKTVRAVERQGCKVIGIGIGADFVRQIYRETIVVSDFQQMAEHLVAILACEFRREVLAAPPASYP